MPTAAELKARCRAQGLPVSGTKAVLEERLLHAAAPHSSNPNSATASAAAAVAKPPPAGRGRGKAAAATATHVGVRCDGCGVQAIVGVRYRCAR